MTKKPSAASSRGIAQQKFTVLKRLQKKGKLPNYIADLLHMDIRSVNHYFMLDKLPRKAGTKTNDLKKYEPKILQWTCSSELF